MGKASKNVNTPVNITIGIKELRFLKFEKSSRVDQLKAPLDPNLYIFDFELKRAIIENEKLYSIFLKVSLSEKKNNDSKIALAVMEMMSSFTIVNYDQIVIKETENGELRVPTQLVSITSGLIVSAARGMFAVNVKDLIISNAIIPLINPDALVEKV